MDLVLYYKPTCPYCQKVISYLKSRNRELTMRDISTDPEALETLIGVGGKKQVPCLFVDGKPMYESDDIIQFLESNP